MKVQNVSAAQLVYALTLSFFVLYCFTGCSRSANTATNSSGSPSVAPMVEHTPSPLPAQALDTSSFPVWAQNEYKTEAYLGKTKTAMVSALGPPVSVEGGADDHSDISNKRLAYAYAGDEGAPPQNTQNHVVQVYFASDNNTILTVAVLNAGPTLGDVFTYLCGPGAMPTDLYCAPDPNSLTSAYVYGKTRQGHRFIVSLPNYQSTVLANYSRTFDVKTNQYQIGSPTFNTATWKQATPTAFCVFNNPDDVKPGEPMTVSRWFSANPNGLTHIKIQDGNGDSRSSDSSLKPIISEIQTPARDSAPPIASVQLTSNDAWAGEHFPQTRTRYMTQTDIGSWSYSGVRYAINEMYARHGLTFKSAAIQHQFQKFAWYHPVSSLTGQQAEATFSPIETENKKLLTDRRNVINPR